MTIKTLLITKEIATKKGRHAIKATLVLCPSHRYKFLPPKINSYSKQELDLVAYHKQVADNLLSLIKENNPDKLLISELEMVRINSYTYGFIVKAENKGN